MAEVAGVEEGIPIIDNPFDQFNDWYAKAKSHPDTRMPNAFCLATCSLKGIPSTRMLLMREFSKEGLSFFSSTESRKGRELKENPNASCCFSWEPLFQQVRVKGRVERADELSEKFWSAIGTELQLTVSSFTQDQEVVSRQAFLKKREEIKAEFTDKPIPRVIDQIAYTLKPTFFEFYESNIMMAADRVEYKWNEEKKEWSARRLAP